MKLACPLLALALVAASAQAQSVEAETAAAEAVGLRLLDVETEHHGRATGAAYWYPAVPGGDPVLFADNAVFKGVAALEGAPIAEGRHPVVLLSHGMGGGIQSTAWLAAGLAERGAIVASVDHPNSTWSDFDMSKGIRHWTRAQDLSAALDAVLADAELSAHADASRIVAVGFSFGGWSALSLGGARANHAGLLETCREAEAGPVYCEEFMSNGIDLAGVDPEAWNADYRDGRVTSVVAIDPGFVWGVEGGDLTLLVDRVTLVGLGTNESRLLATDFDASGFADLLPTARVLRVAPATHFTAMPLCKSAGEGILAEEQDDPVCTDPPGTDRAEVHARIVDAVASHWEK